MIGTHGERAAAIRGACAGERRFRDGPDVFKDLMGRRDARSATALQPYVPLAGHLSSTSTQGRKKALDGAQVPRRARYDARAEKDKGSRMDGAGSVVVFDRNHASLRYLALVTEREPRFAKAVADWLDCGDLPFLLLGSTGGTDATQFALCARSTPHLLGEMLEEAAALLGADVQCGCLATAVDESMNEMVTAAWSEILALGLLPAASTARSPPPDLYLRTVGLSTRT